MIKVCILLVFLTYVYYDARFIECKASCLCWYKHTGQNVHNVREKVYEEDAREQKEGIKRRLEETAWWRSSWSVILTDCCLAIKSRRIRWPGIIARMEEKRNEQRIPMGNLKERDHIEDVKLVWMIILKSKKCVMVGRGLNRSGVLF